MKETPTLLKKGNLPTLRVEWASNHVRGFDNATGRVIEANSIAELARQFPSHKEVMVGVSRGQVFLKTVSLPKAAPEDLRQLLNARLSQYFPLPANDLAFDAYQTNLQEKDGYLTVIAAMRASDYLQLQAELTKVGWKAAQILPIAFGAVHHCQDGLVEEIHGNYRYLDVVQNGIVRFSRVAPADAPTAPERQRTLLAAGATDLPQREGGDALRGLHKALPFSFARNEDRLATRKKQLAGKTRLSFLLIFASILLGSLLFLDRMDAQAVVDKGAARWDTQLKQLRTIRDAETTKAQRALGVQQSITQAFAPGQSLTDIVAILGDNLPAGAWLMGVVAERGKPIQIRGLAKSGEDVARIVSNLSAQRRFRDVKLLFANSAKIDQTMVVQFNITATAVGNLPMPVAPKSNKSAVKREPATPTATGDAK
jgi:Tfp pilus assembly protein PilN